MRILTRPFRLSTLLILLGLLGLAPTLLAAGRLGPLLEAPAASGVGWSRVIIRAADGSALDDVASAVAAIGGVPGRQLPIIHAQTAYLPNAALSGLANSAFVDTIWSDRRVSGAMERTGATVGAPAVRAALGYDGSGVTVAIVDSGITAWHDDLANASGAQRVVRFVDFIGGSTTPYDDYGHGTHVAGIVAGNGADSSGARTGIAPGAQLVVLKAIDANGTGRISNVIAALDYIVANKDALAIRVVNLSIAAGVFESYTTDPLTVAAKRVNDAGVVVVAAAGNAGRDQYGNTVYGGITAPGNAPWVITVGASSHMGTPDRSDDTMAAFSSRGPTAFDHTAKPDLVAPGVGTESLSAFGSTLYARDGAYLLDGTLSPGYLPYLSLSGTSMAAPVATGTVALMLQANPSLTPNAVKAILRYTAESRSGYDRLTQGAGFLNAQSAVTLARTITNPTSTNPSVPLAVVWSGSTGGSPALVTTTDDTDTVVWGSTDEATVVWGSSDLDTVVWGSDCDDAACDPIVWGR